LHSASTPSITANQRLALLSRFTLQRQHDHARPHPEMHYNNTIIAVTYSLDIVGNRLGTMRRKSRDPSASNPST